MAAKFVRSCNLLLAAVAINIGRNHFIAASFVFGYNQEGTIYSFLYILQIICLYLSNNFDHQVLKRVIVLKGVYIFFA